MSGRFYGSTHLYLLHCTGDNGYVGYETKHNSTFVSTISRCAEVVLASLSLFLNVVVIVVLLQMTCKGTIKPSLKFVLNLAICDGSFALYHLIRKNTFFASPWDILQLMFAVGSMYLDERIVGVVFGMLYYVIMNVSLATIVFIAADLLILVMWPLRYAYLMSSRRCTVMVVMSWIVSLGLWTSIGVLHASGNRTGAIISLIICLFLNVLLPTLCLIVFIVLYAIIICKIRSLVNRTPFMQYRSMMKSTVTVACVLLTYFVCNMPSIWIIVMAILSIYTNTNFVMLVGIVRCLFVVNTVCDPMIYAVRLPELRERIVRLLKTPLPAFKLCKTPNSV